MKVKKILAVLLVVAIAAALCAVVQSRTDMSAR